MENTPANPTLPEEVKFILNKDYKEVTTIDEDEYFGKVKRGIEMLPLDDKFFKTVQSLIKFFKFSFLLFLKKPFETMANDPQLPPQRQTDMKRIAKIAHDIIGGGHIDQLNFLFVKGIDHNFYKKIDIKQEKRKFIDYIKELSAEKKKLYKMIEEKSINEDHIMAFQSKSFGKDLMKLDYWMENQIKICLKDVEAKYQEIEKERKKRAKQAALEKQKQQRAMSQQITPTQQCTNQNPISKQSQNLQDIMVCCRRSFFHKQTIYQPQSINFVYRYFNDYFRQQYHFDILKTICGLLNSQGGYLFIGIKEDKNTYKKQAEGYTIIEKDKADFKKMVEEMVDKCIQPTISHDILKIQFVPLKSAESNKFISGKYIIKICVRYGERKQFYSFKEFSDSKKEFFSVRTDTDTKIITSAQQILGIYKTRVLETPPDPSPIHKDPCPWPQVGRPLYELEELGGREINIQFDDENSESISQWFNNQR